MGRRGIAPAFLRGAGGALKVRFVEINHPGGRIGQGNGCRFENFMIERDGQFLFVQARTDEQAEFAGDGACLREGFASDGIQDRLTSQFNAPDDEPAMQPEIYELADVNHGEIQTALAAVVHLNSKPCHHNDDTAPAWPQTSRKDSTHSGLIQFAFVHPA